MRSIDRSIDRDDADDGRPALRRKQAEVDLLLLDGDDEEEKKSYYPTFPPTDSYRGIVRSFLKRGAESFSCFLGARTCCEQKQAANARSCSCGPTSGVGNLQGRSTDELADRRARSGDQPIGATCKIQGRQTDRWCHVSLEIESNQFQLLHEMREDER